MPARGPAGAAAASEGSVQAKACKARGDKGGGGGGGHSIMSDGGRSRQCHCVLQPPSRAVCKRQKQKASRAADTVLCLDRQKEDGRIHVWCPCHTRGPRQERAAEFSGSTPVRICVPVRQVCVCVCQAIDSTHAQTAKCNRPTSSHGVRLCVCVCGRAGVCVWGVVIRRSKTGGNGRWGRTKARGAASGRGSHASAPGHRFKACAVNTSVARWRGRGGVRLGKPGFRFRGGGGVR